MITGGAICIENSEISDPVDYINDLIDKVTSLEVLPAGRKLLKSGWVRAKHEQHRWQSVRPALTASPGP